MTELEEAVSGRSREPRAEHLLRKGQGSFYFRSSDQRWIGVVDLGRQPSGQRKRIIVSDKDEDVAWQKFQARRKQVFAEHRSDSARSAEEVIDLARSFGQNPVTALVEAGYLYPNEAS